MFPQSLILGENSQNPHFSVSVGRTTSGVPGGVGQFATSHHDRRSPPRMKIAQAIFTSVSTSVSQGAIRHYGVLRLG
jgi:hypothetical protein